MPFDNPERYEIPTHPFFTETEHSTRLYDGVKLTWRRYATHYGFGAWYLTNIERQGENVAGTKDHVNRVRKRKPVGGNKPPQSRRAFPKNKRQARNGAAGSN